jgi:hypothetical protein
MRHRLLNSVVQLVHERAGFTDGTASSTSADTRRKVAEEGQGRCDRCGCAARSSPRPVTRGGDRCDQGRWFKKKQSHRRSGAEFSSRREEQVVAGGRSRCLLSSTDER